MTGRPVRVLLDASAVAAFCRSESIGLGEIIAEVTTENAMFGLTVPCLAAAYADVRDHDLLELLLDHPSFVLLAEEPTLWRELAQTLPLVDRYDVASTAVAAAQLGAYILTRRPGWYVKLTGGGPVIEV